MEDVLLFIPLREPAAFERGAGKPFSVCEGARDDHTGVDQSIYFPDDLGVPVC